MSALASREVFPGGVEEAGDAVGVAGQGLLFFNNGGVVGANAAGAGVVVESPFGVLALLPQPVLDRLRLLYLAFKLAQQRACSVERAPGLSHRAVLFPGLGALSVQLVQPPAGAGDLSVEFGDARVQRMQLQIQGFQPPLAFCGPRRCTDVGSGSTCRAAMDGADTPGTVRSDAHGVEVGAVLIVQSDRAEDAPGYIRRDQRMVDGLDDVEYRACRCLPLVERDEYGLQCVAGESPAIAGDPGVEQTGSEQRGFELCRLVIRHRRRELQQLPQGRAVAELSLPRAARDEGSRRRGVLLGGDTAALRGELPMLRLELLP